MSSLNRDPQTEERRIKLNAEINSHKVVIDRSVFVKSEEEKATLKNMKRVYKAKH